VCFWKQKKEDDQRKKFGVFSLYFNIFDIGQLNFFLSIFFLVLELKNKLKKPHKNLKKAKRK